MIREKVLFIAKQSFIEAVISTLIFILIYLTYNIEITRSNVSDVSFSYLNGFINNIGINLDSKTDKKLNIFYIDKNYLKNNNFLDEYNNTNYGIIFPRSQFAKIIKSLDSYPKNKQPFALFIDYDLSDGSASYDINNSYKHLSGDDIKFIESLANDRSYYILLPRIKEKTIVEEYINFYQNSISEKIKKLIKENKIIFVGVKFLKNKNDNKIYRYLPYEKFKDSKKRYYSVSVVLWQLIKNGYIDEKEIEKEYNKTIFDNLNKITKNGMAIYLTNILYGEKTESLIRTSLYDEHISNWHNTNFYSLLKLLKEKNLKDNIIFIGSKYNTSDIHHDNLGDGILGIDIHSNILNTILFFDGSLDRINLFLGLFITFMIFFAITFITRLLLPQLLGNVRLYLEIVLFIIITAFSVWIIYKIFGLILGFLFFILLLGLIFVYYKYFSSSLWVYFVLEFFLLTLSMLVVSTILLIKYKVWFNWYIPIVIFYLDDLIIIWKEYSIKNQKKVEG